MNFSEKIDFLPLFEAVSQQFLHRFFIAFCLVLGFALWDLKRSIFSFSFKRIFSLFFIIFSVQQLKNIFLIGKNGITSNYPILEYLVLGGFPRGMEKSPYLMAMILFASLFTILWISACLVLGLSLWETKMRPFSFRWKKVFSITFLIFSLRAIVFFLLSL